MLCPFCFCLTLSCINTSICCSVNRCLSFSIHLSAHPIRLPVCLSLVSVSEHASCSWFSTADSSTGLISPGRVQRQLVHPKCGLSVRRIMLTSPCTLCNHCESIVAQEFCGLWVESPISFFCWNFFWLCSRLFDLVSEECLCFLSETKHKTHSHHSFFLRVL